MATKSSTAKPKTAASKTAATKAASPAAKPKTPRAMTAQSADPGCEFILTAPGAGEVCLVGDFNNWEHTKGKMRKGKGDTFKKNLSLTPGRYEYRFVVDGIWWTDPNNDNRCANVFGEENSVIIISG